MRLIEKNERERDTHTDRVRGREKGKDIIIKLKRDKGVEGRREINREKETERESHRERERGRERKRKRNKEIVRYTYIERDGER